MMSSPLPSRPILASTAVSAPSRRIATEALTAPPPQWVEMLSASTLAPCSSSRNDEGALCIVMRSMLRLSTMTMMSIIAEPMQTARMNSPQRTGSVRLCAIADGRRPHYTKCGSISSSVPAAWGQSQAQRSHGRFRQEAPEAQEVQAAAVDSPTQLNIGYFLVALMAILVFQAWWAYRETEQIPYSQFQQLLDEGRIAEVEVSDNRIRGRYVEPRNGRSYFITNRVDPELSRRLEEAGVEFTGALDTNWFTTLLSWIIPVLLILASVAVHLPQDGRESRASAG
jgi:hypothetical protein